MKGCNINKKVYNENGVTLVALIITIVVMLIIAGISIGIGTDTLDSTRLQGFYMQLETIQKRVDDIATTNESYIDSKGNTIYLKQQGTPYANLSTSQKNIIAQEIAGTGLKASTFRYFTIEQLEAILDLKEMSYNVFIDFESRTVIADGGITINGIQYYSLPNNMYYPEFNTDKNQGEIEALSYSISKYGTTGKYRIRVTPSNKIGDLEGIGTLRYKKTTSKYWETSNNLEMIIDELTQYNVEYKDKNNNTITEIIEVKFNASGILICNKIVQS